MRSWRRRLVMPLLIVVVALTLVTWNSRREDQTTDEVRQFVVSLCDDLASGRDPMPRLRGTNPLVAEPLVRRLRAITATSSPDTVTVTVSTGDVEVAPSGPPATHTAVVRAGDQDAIGLRLVHHDPGTDIVVVGFWTDLSAP